MNDGVSVLNSPLQAALVAPPAEPAQGDPEEGLGSCPNREDVWRRNGSMENMARCVEAVLASFIARY